MYACFTSLFFGFNGAAVRRTCGGRTVALFFFFVCCLFVVSYVDRGFVCLQSNLLPLMRRHCCARPGASAAVTRLTLGLLPRPAPRVGQGCCGEERCRRAGTGLALWPLPRHVTDTRSNREAPFSAVRLCLSLSNRRARLLCSMYLHVAAGYELGSWPLL